MSVAVLCLLEEFYASGDEKSLERVKRMTSSLGIEELSLVVEEVVFLLTIRPHSIDVASSILAENRERLPNALMTVIRRPQRDTKWRMVAFLHILKELVHRGTISCDLVKDMMANHPFLAEKYGYFLSSIDGMSLHEDVTLNSDDLRVFKSCTNYFSHKATESVLEGAYTVTQLGFYPHLRTALIEDNKRELQIVLTDATAKVKFNEVISPNCFQPFDMLQHSPSLLQLAAFFGAVNCFKYLLLSGATPNYKDAKNNTCYDFAIAGGNREILSLLQCSDGGEVRAIEVAIKYRRWECMKWLEENISDHLMSDKVKNCFMAKTACIHNNMRCLRERSLEEYAGELLLVATSLGYYQIVSYILHNTGIDANVTDEVLV